jgi:ribokinase
VIDVLVVGSINVDLSVAVDRLPHPGETVTGGRFWRAQGGKGANQAVAAARFGAAVAMVAAVGEDDLGQNAIEELTAEGVDVSQVRCVSGLATGVALIVVGDKGENLIAVASGANSVIDPSDVARAVLEFEPRVILVNLEIGDSAIVAAANAAKRMGASLVLNPAPFRALPTEVLAATSVITPNEHEARALLGDAIEGPGIARLAEGAGLSRAHLVVTVGPRGALRVTKDQVFAYRAKIVEAVDTTGAGDAFNGVLAASLSAGTPIDKAIESAVAAGTLATLAVGARAGMPSKAQVEEFLRSSPRVAKLTAVKRELADHLH